eukprot:TRINITY_DN279_c0_g1_i2.p1 TRINITY_DN279_c0_g1~~TRINITY_DN279_c0_g1_i2.p1  ORF type:complete len:641 (-),score=129.09 TRINITY_DN279_c0_g1_i2:66-1988(-)
MCIRDRVSTQSTGKMSETNPTQPAPAKKPPSKKELAKLEKQKKQLEARLKREAEAEKKKKEQAEKFKHLFGFLPLAPQYQERQTNVLVKISSLELSLVGEQVWIQGRIHATRDTGNITFLEIRSRLHSIQAVVAKTPEIPKEMVKFAGSLSKETIVKIQGKVTKPQETIQKVTQHDVEISVEKIFVVSSSLPVLPIQIEDAARPQPIIDKQIREVELIDEQIEIAESELYKLGLAFEEGRELDRQISKLVEKEASNEQDFDSSYLNTEIKEAIAIAKKKIRNLGLSTENGKKINGDLESLAISRSAANKYVVVHQDTRLTNRILDLRVPSNQAIFKIQSAVGALFREYLVSNGFIEIHTPKLISAASEGGAEVFPVTYFDRKAFLAQSPQLYKQMAICSDLERVFEIGPVFRAENSNTHRHLCEFVGLDLEMQIDNHYSEVLELLGGLFVYIFKGLEKTFQAEFQIINNQFPFEPLKYLEPTLVLKFPEAVELVRGSGGTINDFEDLSTTNERLLGKLVREKYNTDFFILDKFPLAARPFYTMPDPDDNRYSNSYDIFIRGEEICSGSQRVHDSNFLAERAKSFNIDIATIKAYLDAFKYGAPPHGGAGIGLERVAMLYLNLNNIRKTSMFPRDPSRLTP